MIGIALPAAEGEVVPDSEWERSAWLVLICGLFFLPRGPPESKVRQLCQSQCAKPTPNIIFNVRRAFRLVLGILPVIFCTPFTHLLANNAMPGTVKNIRTTRKDNGKKFFFHQICCT